MELRRFLSHEFLLSLLAQKLPKRPEDESINDKGGCDQKLSIHGNRHGNMVLIPAPLLKQGISEAGICSNYIFTRVSSSGCFAQQIKQLSEEEFSSECVFFDSLVLSVNRERLLLNASYAV